MSVTSSTGGGVDASFRVSVGDAERGAEFGVIVEPGVLGDGEDVASEPPQAKTKIAKPAEAAASLRIPQIKTLCYQEGYCSSDWVGSTMIAEMTDPRDVALSLFLYWVREAFGRGFQVRDRGELNTAEDGQHTIFVAVRTLVPFESSGWERRLAQLEELISDDLPVRIALWVPAGADLPMDEPALSEFVSLVRQAALKLGPHERSYVFFPIELRLRKNQETGGVVSVTGGLNPHWAKFTERVRGSYDLDSTQLHRLPESEEHLDSLLDTIVERTKELEIGQIAKIETIDAWTVQRLSGTGGVTIVGVPPAETADLGLTVRRNFRRTLVEVAPKLRAVAEPVRALVVLAPYARIEQEGATTALRGYDPALFTGIDFICLASDGLIKPLIQPPAGSLPWASASVNT